MSCGGGEDAVVGVVRLARGGDPAQARSPIELGVTRATERLFGEALRTLLAHEQHPLRERLEAALLAYAGRHLIFQANDLGVITPQVSRPLAADVLWLPLFPTGDGAAVAAWRLVTEFCVLGVGAFAERTPETTLHRVLAAQPPPHLEAWIRGTLHESRVVRPSAHVGPAELPPAAAPASWNEALARLNGHWTELCSEGCQPEPLGGALSIGFGHPAFSAPRGRKASRGWAAEPEAAAAARGDVAILDPDSGQLCLDPSHWLVQRVWQHPEDREATGWLLLGCYAVANHALAGITNEHELAFARRVLDWIDRLGG
jgi:hypothetical protein